MTITITQCLIIVHFRDQALFCFLYNWPLGSSIKYVRKIFQKTNISNPPDTHTFVFRIILRTYLMDGPFATSLPTLPIGTLWTIFQQFCLKKSRKEAHFYFKNEHPFCFCCCCFRSIRKLLERALLCLYLWFLKKFRPMKFTGFHYVSFKKCLDSESSQI